MNVFNDIFYYLITTSDCKVQYIIKNILKMICEYFNIYCSIICLIDDINKNINNETNNSLLFIKKISIELKDNKVNEINKNIFKNDIIESIPNDIEYDKIKNKNFNKDSIIESQLVDNKHEIIYLKLNINNDDDGILIIINEQINNIGTIKYDSIRKLIDNVFLYIKRITNIDKKKIEFISGINNKVKMPLNTIMTMTEIIVKNDKIDENDKNNLNMIKKSGIELMNILNNASDYIKVLTNKIKLKYEPISLLKCIKIVFLMLEEKITEKNLKISFKYDENIPEMIITDSLRLKQILMNLLSNSIKFTKKGNIQLFIECINKNEEYCDIMFKIIYTSICIESDKINNMFDYLKKTEENKLINNYGNCVELKIIMHIISLLNGKIEIKNDKIDNLSERMTTNIKIKFNIFNENIDDNLIKDYFYNKKILVLNNNKKRRIELLRLFKKINMNITITASFDEMIEYMEIDNLYEIILINYSDIEHSDIINFYKIKDDKPKILTINNNDNIEENILYDYKLENPFYYEDVLKILHLIYTINKFELGNFKSEIINNNILYKLDKFDNNKIKNTNVKILIVDDNNQNQQFMKYILKFKKLYNVDNAEDGKEAYEKMIINDYNFVILDIKIPIYDGFTVVKKYKEKYPDKKIFITTMTSNPTEKIKKECFDLKINAFLPKPINIDDLDKIINLMLKTL